MISLETVSFKYQGQEELLENLTMELPLGRIYGLVGKNGSGKSTVLRIISGLLCPSNGHVTVGNFDPFRRNWAFLKDIFFLPEDPYLPAISLNQLATSYGTFYPTFDMEEFYNAIHSFEIDRVNRLDKLSQGQKKKVLIALGLAANTGVVIMDEPTNGLDMPSKVQFRKLVSKSIRDDRLFLISTHNVMEFENLIDSLIVFDRGKKIVQCDINKIERKLAFVTTHESVNEEFVLFWQAALGGRKIVVESQSDEESAVDLEQFFHAVLADPVRIKNILEIED